MPAPHYRLDALPDAQSTVTKHSRQNVSDKRRFKQILAATLRGSGPGVQSASLIMMSLMTS